jgi:hypothetical protein
MATGIAYGRSPIARLTNTDWVGWNIGRMLGNSLAGGTETEET